MRRIISTSFVLCALAGFIVWSDSPLNDTVNFIIGGTIPGTSMALGFWPSIGIILILLWALMRHIKNVKHEMVEHATEQYKAEQARDEFAQSYGTKDSALQKAILGQRELNTGN